MATVVMASTCGRHDDLLRAQTGEISRPDERHRRSRAAEEQKKVCRAAAGKRRQPACAYAASIYQQQR